MPLIDVKCQTCGAEDEVHRPVAMWPATPPCPKCDGPTEQIFLPPGFDRTLPPAVVVYQTPNGEFRFPGRTDGSSTKKYDKLGYTRIEARGWAEVRQLESRMNRKEFSRACRIAEHQQQVREESTARRRREVRRQIEMMGEGGRKFARFFLGRLDANERRPRTAAPGLFVEAYSQDRSNR